jgi:hypothetical protein
MLRQTLYRGLNTRQVSVVLLCSLCLGLTLGGCGGCPAILRPNTLEIILEGAIPRAYTLEVSVPGGKPYTLECGSNTASAVPRAAPEPYGFCQDKGVMFYYFAPDEMTITLLWDSQRISQSFKPTYATQWPDGVFCQRVRVGSVSLTIP